MFFAKQPKNTNTNIWKVNADEMRISFVLSLSLLDASFVSVVVVVVVGTANGSSGDESERVEEKKIGVGLLVFTAGCDDDDLKDV